jgi:hypothetical protein
MRNTHTYCKSRCLSLRYRSGHLESICIVTFHAYTYTAYFSHTTASAARLRQSLRPSRSSRGVKPDWLVPDGAALDLATLRWKDCRPRSGMVQRKEGQRSERLLRSAPVRGYPFHGARSCEGVQEVCDPAWCVFVRVGICRRCAKLCGVYSHVDICRR